MNGETNVESLRYRRYGTIVCGYGCVRQIDALFGTYLVSSERVRQILQLRTPHFSLHAQFADTFAAVQHTATQSRILDILQ